MQNLRQRTLQEYVKDTICSNQHTNEEELGEYVDEDPNQGADVSVKTVSPRITQTFSGNDQPFNTLDDDSLDLLGIVHAAGGIIPECFFTTAFTYDPVGDPKLVDVTVADIITNETRKEAAITKLLEHRLLLACDLDGSLVVHPEAALWLSREDDRQRWEVAALGTVCRAFPRWWIPISR